MEEIITYIVGGILFILILPVGIRGIANLIYEIKFAIDEYKRERDREKREQEERERCKAEGRPYYGYRPGCCVSFETDYTKWQGGN